MFKVSIVKNDFLEFVNIKPKKQNGTKTKRLKRGNFELKANNHISNVKVEYYKHKNQAQNRLKELAQNPYILASMRYIKG